MKAYLGSVKVFPCVTVFTRSASTLSTCAKLSTDPTVLVQIFLEYLGVSADRPSLLESIEESGSGFLVSVQVAPLESKLL